MAVDLRENFTQYILCVCRDPKEEPPGYKSEESALERTRV
jgi:hypothetical protein